MRLVVRKLVRSGWLALWQASFFLWGVPCHLGISRLARA